jgi:hypothetical protein
MFSARPHCSRPYEQDLLGQERIMKTLVIGASGLVGCALVPFLTARAPATLERPSQVVVSTSAAGYYGNRGDEVLVEESSLGSGFLADEGRVAW